jgi:hypothetical protein
MVKVQAALTVTGKGKKECQDAIKIDRLETAGSVLFALADGAGSAPYAKKGAEFIVNNFVEILKRKLSESCLPKRSSLASLPLLREVKISLKETRKKLIEMSVSKGLHPENFHSTFVGGIIFEDHFNDTVLAYVSVGDSVIIAFDEKMNVAHLNAITLAEYPNTTVFVTSPEFENVITGGIVENPKRIFISSDGLDGVFFSQKFIAEKENSEKPLAYYDKFLWKVEVFPNLPRFVETICSGEMSEEKLKSFLSMDKVFEYNGDDKSLILFEVTNGSDDKSTKFIGRDMEEKEEISGTTDRKRNPVKAQKFKEIWCRGRTV